MDAELVSAEADYEADDWLNASGSAFLGLQGGIALRRGLDLELGASAVVELAAALEKFILLEANASASASARIKGQVQFPTDLFSEFGIAVRLQAAAEAAVAVKLGLGLSMRDFIALAEADPGLRGPHADLLIVLLEESTVKAEVLGSLSVSAMAYANLAVTGRLISATAPDGRQLAPGFDVVAEYGFGVKAGGGLRVAASVGVSDPQRLVRRSIDTLVDGVATELEAQVDTEEGRRAVARMRLPAKIALRTAFELGTALAETAALSAANDPTAVAERCITVAVEEIQRVLLDLALTKAAEYLENELIALQPPLEEWERLRPQREALAHRLLDLSDGGGLGSDEALEHWMTVVANLIDLVAEFADLDDATAPGALDAVSMSYALLELTIGATEQIDSASARVSFLGSTSITAPEPAAYELHLTPPTLVSAHIRKELGLPAGNDLDRAALVGYIVKTAVFETLLVEHPAITETISPFVTAISGSDAGAQTVQAIQAIFGGGSGLLSETGGDRSAVIHDALVELVGFLNKLLTDKLTTSYVELIEPELKSKPDVALLAREVLLDAVNFTVNTGMTSVVRWHGGEVTDVNVLREAMSTVVFRLFSRSLAATTDILLNHALNGAQAGLDLVSNFVRSDNGPAHVLSTMTPMDRAEVTEELDIVIGLLAQSLRPFSSTERARFRALVYDVLDLRLDATQDSAIEILSDDLFVPNVASLGSLAFEMASMLAERMWVFVTGLLQRLARLVLDLLVDIVQALQEMVTEFLNSLQEAFNELVNRIAELPKLIAEALSDAGKALADALSDVSRFIELLAGGQGSKGQLSAAISDTAWKASSAALKVLPAYGSLSKSDKKKARVILSSLTDDVLADPIVDDVLAALSVPSSWAQEIVEELRQLILDLSGLEPERNIIRQVKSLLLSRVTALVRSAIGGGKKSSDITIKLTIIEVDPPPIWGPVRWEFLIPVEWGWYDPPPSKVEISLKLGTVSVAMNAVVQTIHDTLESMALLEDYSRKVFDDIVASLAHLADASKHEDELDKAKVELEVIEDELDGVELQQDEVELHVLSPLPSSIHRDSVEARFALRGVPQRLVDGGSVRRLYVWLNEADIEPERLNFTPVDGEAGQEESGGSSVPQEFGEDSNVVPPERRQGGSNRERAPAASRAGSDAGRSPGSRPRDLPRLPSSTWQKRPAVWIKEDDAEPLAVASSESLKRGVLLTSAAGAARQHDSVSLRGAWSLDAGEGRAYDPRTLSAGIGVDDERSILADLGAEAVVGVRLARDELQDGANTLTIALVDGRGFKLEHSVVFLVEPKSVGDDPLSTRAAENDAARVAETLANIRTAFARPLFKDESVGARDDGQENPKPFLNAAGLAPVGAVRLAEAERARMDFGTLNERLGVDGRELFRAVDGPDRAEN
ncbi:MAG: hypothetical protein AAFZ07_23375 [Actinomycetota bacterium]